jgi:hypothetical protein
MNPFGRPRKYQSVEEVEKIIEEFFKDCAENELFPTVTGLCLALDLTREGLLTYQGRAEFADTIKRAKQCVEFAVEQKLMEGSGSPAGAIFNLKNNFGWVDEKTHNQNVKGELRTLNILPVSPEDG